MFACSWPKGWHLRHARRDSGESANANKGMLCVAPPGWQSAPAPRNGSPEPNSLDAPDYVLHNCS
eukprot:364904-Chlamydomonas_euryale.AAC.16